MADIRIAEHKRLKQYDEARAQMADENGDYLSRFERIEKTLAQAAPLPLAHLPIERIPPESLRPELS